VDENNHALAALRYLVSKLDEHRQARPQGPPPAPPVPPPAQIVKFRSFADLMRDDSC
jgi:hypothetical protein